MAKAKAKSSPHKIARKTEKPMPHKAHAADSGNGPPPGSANHAKGAHPAGSSHGNGQPAATALSSEAQLAQVQQSIGSFKSSSGVDLTEKVKELLRLAQEQGYLTYNDINDALPDTIVSADELDEIYIKLRNLEVEIVDQAEVDRLKQPEPDEGSRDHLARPRRGLDEGPRVAGTEVRIAQELGNFVICNCWIRRLTEPC